MTTVLLVVLGFAVVGAVIALWLRTDYKPSRDRSMSPLTPAIVRDMVRAAEPLSDDSTSVRTVRPCDADAVRSTIDDVVIRTMGWPDGMVDRYGEAVGLDLVPNLMVITEARDEVVIGVVSLDPLPVQRREAYHRTARLGMWMGPQDRGNGHMGRAVRLLVDLMIANDVSLEAETAITNRAARRVLEGAQMVETRQRTVRLPDGSNADGVGYERHAALFSRQPTQRTP